MRKAPGMGVLKPNTAFLTSLIASKTRLWFYPGGTAEVLHTSICYGIVLSY